MTQTSQDRRISPAARIAGGFRSLLVPIDLSPASDRVLGRVALLPLANNARITLMHMIPGTLSAADQRQAKRDARDLLTAEAKALTRVLPRNVTVEHVVDVGATASSIAERARAVSAALVVMGRGGGRGLRDLFLGSTAERVIRRGQFPVLVVRRTPRARYRRPALALAFDQAAQSAIELLLRLVPTPRPPVTLVHAFEIPYKSLVYPSLTDADAVRYTERYRQRAVDEVAKILASSIARLRMTSDQQPAWLTHVRSGDPRTVIRNAVTARNADIVVIGTRGRTGIAHTFLGTVAGDVLRELSCDILVVPPQHAPATAP